MPLVLASALAASAGPAPAPQGAELLKVDLLGVFAHPDDETGVASTIAHYARGRNKIVAHAYLTRGEGGGNMVGTQSGPALGMLREAELRDCLSRLGVRYCYFLDQLDWAYTESLTATLRKWGREETLGRVVRVIRTLRPDVILTMNPAPNPGQHGHHQAAGVLAIEAFTAAADPSRFPDQLGPEGLTVWQARKIYIGGGGTNATAIVAVDASLPDGRTPAQVAAEALAQHRSQAFGSFANAPWLSRPQAFTLVKSVIGFPDREEDLLGNLPPAGAAVERMQSTRPAPTASLLPGEFRLSFLPRPALANYQRWVRQEGIAHLAGRFRADVPLIAGEANLVNLELIGTGEPAREAGSLRLDAPEGWAIDPPMRRVAPGSTRTNSLAFRVTPPAGRPADGELKATFSLGPKTAAATAIGHPVPILRIPKVRPAPRMDGSDAGWSGLSVHRIAPTDLAQGKATDEADSSAQFSLAHDGRTLFIDVRVADDRVVSNIAPNDIKGHWRSDSIEICVDPAAGAEDTMGCYKLGVFPFDTTGLVRAARDADARQGPAETTAPGTRLLSVRTAQGYRIQAAIPFAEIGVKARRGLRLGFNLIIYDGDKVDAAPGENINQSRLAWSPRPGVQGRPEDWGRVELE